MTLDEKTCWNLTSIVMDDVNWEFEVFFQAYVNAHLETLFKVSLSVDGLYC
jgi:hypothetical protein